MLRYVFTCHKRFEAQRALMGVPHQPRTPWPAGDFYERRNRLSEIPKTCPKSHNDSVTEPGCGVCQATCLLYRALSSLLHSQHRDDKGTKLVLVRWEIGGSPETVDTVDKQCRGFLRKEGPHMRERLELLLSVWRACVLLGGALPLPTCTSLSRKFPSCLQSVGG